MKRPFIIGVGALVGAGVAAIVACKTDEPAPPADEVKPTVAPVVTPESPNEPPPVAQPAPPPVLANLIVRVRDDRGQFIPARLTFLGANGTRTPKFTRTDVGLELPHGVLAYNRAFISGEAAMVVPVGSYRISFSHGPEWDAVEKLVHVTKGTSTVEVTLHHVVDTPGWISGDFHVHAEKSTDSLVPMRHRALQFAADGVDLIVATDHNVVADYAPVIRDLGLSLLSLRGDEVTTKDWGHFGAFPFAEGAAPVATTNRTPAQIFADLRAQAPTAVIDVHHPRLENGHIGYFHLGELDTAKLRSKRPGFSFEFDAVEVLNGYQDPDRHSVDAVLADWFSFLRRGRHVTATGNSDSHHLTFNLGGFPRNYVDVSDVTKVDGEAIARAVKAGQSYFTTGPIVEVTIGDHGIGDTVKGKRIALHVVVRAPAWISVDRVTILVDGTSHLVRPARGAAPVRFDETLTIPLERDTFLNVRVDGDKPMAPMIGDGLKFRVFPLAVTNPIWVDADGDGTVTPSVVGD